MPEFDRREFLIASAGVIAVGEVFGSPAQAAQADIDVQTHAFATPAGADKPLLLDLYRPVGAKRPLPVIVFVHGGAFILGDRKMCPDLRRYFAQAGFAMASIEYRLVPHITFPSNVEDVRTSVRWLRLNAGRLGLDPGRIGLWGTSAGGYLVSMAGLLPPDLYVGTEYLDQSNAVSCVLDGYGVSDFAATSRQLVEEKPHLEPIVKGVETLPNPRVEGERAMTPEVLAMFGRMPGLYLGGELDAIPEKVKAANPITYINKKAPPFLIMHGLSDSSVPRGQSIMLYEALAKADADATLQLVHGLPHTFFNMPGIDEVAGPFKMQVRSHPPGRTEVRIDETRLVFDVARDFFKRHLI